MTFGLRTDVSGNFAAITSGTEDVAKFGATGIQACLPVASYASDAAAAAAGVPVGGLYHTSGTVKVRLT